MERIWSECDKVLIKLIRYNVAQYSALQNKLFSFDELNMQNTKPLVRDLYKRLEKRTEEELLELILLIYDLYLPEGTKPKKPNKAWLRDQLSGFDGTLLFIYLNEVERKRDRFLENLLSTDNRGDLEIAIKKASAYWARQTSEVVDKTALKALIKAYKDGGVSMVRWNTQKDTKVCATCDKLEGKVFAIDNIPDRHWNCRCFLTIVK